MTDYSKNKETITNLIEKPLDSTLRAAIGNMANQQFTIDETGILGRKIEKAESGEDGETAEKFSPRQVRLINNVLLFTEDNWLTSSLALGEVSLDDNTTAYGLIADVLVGNLIMGSNLKISNESNTITLDESGITIKVPGEDGDGETVFSADNSGNVMLKGRIYATDGTIGGLTIGESGIGVARKIEGDVTTFALAFSENGITTSNESFGVTADGVLTAKSGTIGGLKLSENSISASNGSFSVDNNGYLTAKSGTIGGFTIGSTALYNGTASMTSTEAGVYLGTDGLNLGGKFKAAKDGSVTITAGSLNLGEGSFTVDNSGKVSINKGIIDIKEPNYSALVSAQGVACTTFPLTKDGKIHITGDGEAAYLGPTLAGLGGSGHIGLCIVESSDNDANQLSFNYDSNGVFVISINGSPCIEITPDGGNLKGNWTLEGKTISTK